MCDQTKMRIPKLTSFEQHSKATAATPHRSSGTDSILKFLAHTRTKGNSVNHESECTPSPTHREVLVMLNQPRLGR